jgi:hypothetical protein
MSTRIVYAFTRNGSVWKCHDSMADAISQAEEVKGSDARIRSDRVIDSDHNDRGPTTYRVETLEWYGERWHTAAILDLTIGPPMGNPRRVFAQAAVR